MIRVLIAEDSPVVQRVLAALLSDEKGIEIVGIVGNGKDAVDTCRKLRPDLVTMDIFMPEMDGLQATRKIMKEFPTRIVIISSMVNSKDLRTSFEAMRSGAIEVVEKPHGLLSGNYSEVKAALIRVIRQMMAARPQNRFSWMSSKPWSPTGNVAVSSPQQRTSGYPSRQQKIEVPSITPDVPEQHEQTQVGPVTTIPLGFVPRVVCIGGSTGAPAVLFDVLSSLPSNYPYPIVVAQHIATGFVSGMVDWLDSSLALDVKVAERNDILRPGLVVVAPDDCHLMLAPDYRVKLVGASDGELYTPSIDIFFESVAESYGATALGIILSGMGRDGAQGLLKMRNYGAMTFGQNESSSVIYGMPKEAANIGAVVQEMSPPEMITMLNKLSKRVGI
jgi:two-component system, chemotaxis family, protein-glutamate methylesterase/glutaminase